MKKVRATVIAIGRKSTDDGAEVGFVEVEADGRALRLVADEIDETDEFKIGDVVDVEFCVNVTLVESAEPEPDNEPACPPPEEVTP